jgi:hypothetical protein
MTTMTQKIDIYAKARLVEQFCMNGCLNRAECNPQTYDEPSGVDASLTVRIVGDQVPCLCPIMLRSFPSTGWLPAGAMCEYTVPGT